jgi:glycosyltransferase involved in cell wall biosynthesis
MLSLDLNPLVSMKILFIHQNFPGQFKFLAPALAAQGHEVVALSMQAKHDVLWQGVRVLRYQATRGNSPQVHPWVSDFETKAIRAEACFRRCLALRDDEDFAPEVIVAHPGWGESLFVKDVWPRAQLGIYCEFFYRDEGADVGFDPEFPDSEPGTACRLRLKNLNNLLHFQSADAGLSPTQWQASTFPEPFRGRITVAHDGIDTQALAPNPNVRLALDTAANGRIDLTRADEIITFVNRNLEPYRGYHVFMRSLPELLRRRPQARVLIVGGHQVSYGANPPNGSTWKDVFANEVRHQIPPEDWQRVHFLGNLPYTGFVALLQASTVHVYLTYPFVLSWSLLEAMSLGCAIVASDTAPVREAVQHNNSGRLVNFFDQAALVEQVCALLEDPLERTRLGLQARAWAQSNFDLQRVCLPQQVAWVKALAGVPDVMHHQPRPSVEFR